MKTLKWSTLFQCIIITLGLTIGTFFSIKSKQLHAQSHIGIALHAPMDHGFIDISRDSIIPELNNLTVIKDPMSGWNLHFNTNNFKFTPEHIGRKHVAGEGHAHLLINGDKAARIYSNWFHIPQLEYDILELEITLNTNDHNIMCIREKPMVIKLSNVQFEKNYCGQRFY